MLYLHINTGKVEYKGSSNTSNWETTVQRSSPGNMMMQAESAAKVRKVAMQNGSDWVRASGILYTRRTI